MVLILTVPLPLHLGQGLGGTIQYIRNPDPKHILHISFIVLLVLFHVDLYVLVVCRFF